MIEFILTSWLHIAIAYGIIYAAYVIYALFTLRFQRNGRRVTESDLAEILGEALIGPILLPCRLIGNFFTLIKVTLLAMVNAGLPKEGK